MRQYFEIRRTGLGETLIVFEFIVHGLRLINEIFIIL